MAPGKDDKPTDGAGALPTRKMTEEEIEQAVDMGARKLVATKKNATRYMNNTLAHMENTDPTESANQTKAKLLMDQLDKTMDSMTQCVMVLEGLNINTDDQEVERYEDRWIDVKTNYTEWAAKGPLRNSGSSAGAGDKSQVYSVIGLNFNIKKVIPESFTGKDRRQYRAWRLKWDEASKQMTELGYSPAKQLCELKLATTDEARKWIEGFPEDDDNLEGALNFLERQYKNTIKDAEDTLKSMMMYGEMKMTVAGIDEGMQLANLAHQTLRGMKIPKEDLADLWFLVASESMLPKQMRHDWQDIKDTKSDPTLPIGHNATFEDWLKCCESRRNKVRSDTEKEKDQNFTGYPKKKEEKKPGDHTTLPGGFAGQRDDKTQKPRDGRGNSRRPKHCILCDKDGHYLIECFLFTKDCKTGEERLNLLKENKITLCRNCLRGNHQTGQCTFEGGGCDCGVKGHHKLLHENRSSQKSLPAQEQKAEGMDRSSYALRTFDKLKNPILQSCLTWYVAGNQEKFKCRVFLDNGSEVTLMRRAFADMVGLMGRHVTLQMSVAGGGVTQPTQEKEVSFQLQSMDGKYITPKLVATTTKTITKELRAINVATEDYKHLKHIKFTEDYPRQEVEVDILIGVQYYTSLLTGEIIKGKQDEPMAIATKLGYILTGSH